MLRNHPLREAARDAVKLLILGLVGYLAMMQQQPAALTTAPPSATQPQLTPVPRQEAEETQLVPKCDPANATVLLQAGNTQCTATILADRPGPGRYYVLSACHCVAKAGTGTVTLKDGRSYAFTVARVSPTADLSLLEITAPAGLPCASVALLEPAVGTAVWHQGYGIDKPGNVEAGKVIQPRDQEGHIALSLSASPGDSGAGIFRTDNGRLVAVVCCGDGKTLWGGSVTEIRRLLKGKKLPRLTD